MRSFSSPRLPAPGTTALLAARLTLVYIGSLERSLTHRSVELDLADVNDLTTRTVMLRTLASHRAGPSVVPLTGGAAAAVSDVAIDDPHFRDIQALRSRDPERIRAVLRAEDGMGALIQYVIPLLASDDVAEDAVRALRMVAEEHIGALIDALLDPNQSFVSTSAAGSRVFGVLVTAR